MFHYILMYSYNKRSRQNKATEDVECVRFYKFDDEKFSLDAERSGFFEICSPKTPPAGTRPAGTFKMCIFRKLMTKNFPRGRQKCHFR